MQYQNILLIDDDLEDQEIFNSALDEVSEELQCTALTNAKEALDQLNRKELTPDVIFLDLNMPLMTGQEFLKEIKRVDHLQSIPVIIFTTSSNAATIEQTKVLGASDFITKPSKFDLLVTILRTILNRH